MNKYQRVGIFLVRVLGAVALALGGLGFLLAVGEHTGLLTPDFSWPSSFGVSLVWLGVGALLGDRPGVNVVQILGRTILLYQRHPKQPRFEGEVALR